MALTTVDKARVKHAGNTIIAFGPKFTTLTAPSLAALTTDVTCVVLSLNDGTNASTIETQDLCDKDAKTTLDKRVRNLSMRLRVSKAGWATLKPLLAEDAEVGVAVRRFDPTTTPLAVSDKVDAYNAKVLTCEFNEIAVGGEYEVAVEFSDVSRERDVALLA